ncbi:MAG: hypothetical protein AAGA31_15180, partial [Bacteroidota bacterium]
LVDDITSKKLQRQWAGKERPVIPSREPKPPKVSNLLAYLSLTYSREYAYRTAREESQSLARNFFGTPVPMQLSQEQTEALAQHFREKLGEHPGVSIEKDLGNEIFTASYIPPHFMSFAIRAGQGTSRSRYAVGTYQSLVPDTRSVLGGDLSSLLNQLETLGLILPEDRNTIPTRPTPPDQKLRIIRDGVALRKLATAVNNREMKAQYFVQSHAYLRNVFELKLLSRQSYDELSVDSTFLTGINRFPAIRQFQQATHVFDWLPNQSVAAHLQALQEAAIKLDPIFDEIDLTHELTANNSPATRPYQDGHDLSLTLKYSGKKYIHTLRLAQPMTGNTPPLLLNEDLLKVFNDFLAAEKIERRLYAVSQLGINSLREKKVTLLLLNEAEAKAVVGTSIEEVYAGFRRFNYPKTRSRD